MQPTTPTTNKFAPLIGNAVLSALLICGALFSVYIQWQFSQLTGSILLFGQGIVQLVLTVFLLSLWFNPPPRWLIVLQFFASFLVLLLCGALLNEAYINWTESRLILTEEALPVVLLGSGGPFLLARLFSAIVGEHYPRIGRQLVGWLLPTLAIALGCVLCLTHFTGYYWLDALAACGTALLVGVVAIFFLLDGYWHLMDYKR